MELNQTAARAAKRFLDDRTRTDWAYPVLPEPWERSDEEVVNAVGIRERFYGESESGSEGDAGDIADVNSPVTDTAYKFDSPDAIGDAVDRTRERKRKRRRMRLEDEMAENEGLRIWVARRDAWTGAASVRKYGARAKSTPPAITQHDSGTGAQDTLPPSPSDLEAAPATPPPIANAPHCNSDPFNLVPVAPRLLADNPIRASINPKAYSDIYAKIVTSSRTPSVPINLADMTRALVQGWKDTNEWPPKIGAVDPLAGRRRGAGAGSGVLGGVLGAGVMGRGNEGNGSGFIHRHPHLEKGVGSVKKILHLSGHQVDGGKEG